MQVSFVEGLSNRDDTMQACSLEKAFTWFTRLHSFGRNTEEFETDMVNVALKIEISGWMKSMHLM